MRRRTPRAIFAVLCAGLLAPLAYSQRADAEILRITCDDAYTQLAIDGTFVTLGPNAGSWPSFDEYNLYVDTDVTRHLNFALADNDPDCNLSLELLAPTEMSYFNDTPVWRWIDGSPVTSLAAPSRRVAPGGHFAAPVTGMYRLRVRSRSGACNGYRLFVARTALPSNRIVWQ